MKKIVFMTATRADYGKMKPVIKEVEQSKLFGVYVYVTGMHMLDQFGSTYNEVLNDKYENTYLDINYQYYQQMDLNVAGGLYNFSKYVSWVKPDMVVIHGDRQDAIAGAIVGAFNNILVAHIEGGEISGTIDESIRHAVTKFAHLHFVANDEAKNRVLQLGERPEAIFTIGSPDIDLMLSTELPSLNEALLRYGICFNEYAILLFHPVVTEIKKTGEQIKNILTALEKSSHNYIVVSPNNDLGNELITSAYGDLAQVPKFRFLPSVRFEFFLTFLKNAKYIIGNSSAGIREACVYGTPTIDIGSRQQGRYKTDVVKNIVHVEPDSVEILEAISNYQNYVARSMTYGSGGSAKKFLEIISQENIWETDKQKRFIDLSDH